MTNGNLDAASHQLGLVFYYASRQWRYRALRDAEALMRKVEGELEAGG